MSPVPENLKSASGAQGTLSPAEKDAQVAELSAMAMNIQKRLQALGATATTRGPRLAPDGGPSSDHHVNLRTHLVETMEVKMKDFNDEVAIIRKKDFDPEFHDPIERTGPRARAKPIRTEESEKVGPLSPAPVVVGMQSRDELLTMTMKSLQALPEAGLIPAADMPDLKDELVDAIMAARTRVKSGS